MPAKKAAGAASGKPSATHASYKGTTTSARRDPAEAPVGGRRDGHGCDRVRLLTRLM